MHRKVSGGALVRRREFIKFLCGAAAGWPLATSAQPSGKIARIGFLVTGSLAETQVSIDAFRQGMTEFGYAEGKDFTLESRGADGRVEQLPRLAKELVARNVDVLVATATAAGRAAQHATTTIPVVVSAMGDPVSDGLIASLARPGGNITGTTFLGPELVPKRLAFLKQLLPKVSHVAVLWHPTAFSERTTADMLKETRSAGASLDIQLDFVEVRNPDELDRAFSEIVKGGAQALLPLPSPLLFSERKRIVELGARHTLPGMFNSREFVELGGLIAYGVNLAELNRQSASYVAKILRGAKPSELPVEQPTKFELLINLKTARTLGIDVPLVLQQVTDEMIE